MLFWQKAHSCCVVVNTPVYCNQFYFSKIYLWVEFFSLFLWNNLHSQKASALWIEICFVHISAWKLHGDLEFLKIWKKIWKSHFIFLEIHVQNVRQQILSKLEMHCFGTGNSSYNLWFLVWAFGMMLSLQSHSFCGSPRDLFQIHNNFGSYGMQTGFSAFLKHVVSVIVLLRSNALQKYPI